MVKLYVIISAVILFAVLLFSPLLSSNSSTQIGTSSTGVQNWVAGPGTAGA